jgi:rubrerythrin
MDIGSILLILALLILVGLFIARPLFDRQAVIVNGRTRREDHEISALLAERDRVLNALQELDFDYSMGKIPEEDYPGQREALVRDGAGVLRRLDEIQAEPDTSGAEERLELAIAARRMGAAQTGLQPGASAIPALQEDDEIEARLASRRRERKDKSAGFCAQCGRPVQKSDRFCPACGSTLSWNG